MALEAVETPQLRNRSWCRCRKRIKRQDNSERLQSFDDVVTEEKYLAICLLMLARGETSNCDTTTAAYSSSSSYKCSICGKVFASYQALGGHKTSHRGPSKSSPSTTGTTTPPPAPVAAGRVHRCGICTREFVTGQALGGHKRLHYMYDKELSSATRFLDLNTVPSKEVSSEFLTNQS